MIKQLHYSFGILLIALGASLAHAKNAETSNENCANCTTTQSIAGIQAISDLTKKLSHSCTTEAEMYLRSAREKYEQLYPATEARVSQNIRGLLLLGTAEEHKFMDEMMGGEPPANWQSLATGCESVVCYLGKLFNSEESALRALTIAKRDGYLMMLHQKYYAESGEEKLFSTQEIRLFDQTLQNLPDNFKHLKTLKFIYRAPSNYHNKALEPDAVAFASRTEKLITFQEGALTLDNFSTVFNTMIHEITHHFDFSMGENNMDANSSLGFSAISGWQQKSVITADKLGNPIYENKDIHSETAGFIREYAAKNRLEDFAESVAAYVIRPENLRNADARKYQLIKDKIFAGREYLPPPVNVSKYKKTCIDSLQSIAIDKNLVKFYWKDGGIFSADIHSPGFTISADKCISMIKQNLERERSDRCVPENDFLAASSMNLKASLATPIGAIFTDLTNTINTAISECVESHDLQQNCVRTKLAKRSQANDPSILTKIDHLRSNYEFSNAKKK